VEDILYGRTMAFQPLKAEEIPSLTSAQQHNLIQTSSQVLVVISLALIKLLCSHCVSC